MAEALTFYEPSTVAPLGFPVSHDRDIDFQGTYMVALLGPLVRHGKYLDFLGILHGSTAGITSPP